MMQKFGNYLVCSDRNINLCFKMVSIRMIQTRKMSTYKKESTRRARRQERCKGNEAEPQRWEQESENANMNGEET